MDPAPFIFISYSLTIAGIGGALILSLLRMRKAERRVESLRRKED